MDNFWHICYTRNKNINYNYKGIEKLRDKVKISQILIILAPTIITSIASILLSGIQLRNIESIKKSGDFATTIMVLEAKAECVDKAEKDLHRHEDWESRQFDTLNAQVSKIYSVLIKE